VHGRFRVTPMVAPDHTQDPASDPIAALVAHASSRVAAEQLDLSIAGRNDLGWTGSDPLADALAQARSNGAAVRVLAAAPFSSADTGNAEALSWLAERGIEAATFDRAGLVLHNKGLVADAAVVVGSLNGNLHSRAQNREVDLIVESPEAAAYFEGLFQGDRDRADPPRDWSVPAQDIRGLPLAPWPILLALLGVVASRGRRWS
jgi:PLD-like domain